MAPMVSVVFVLGLVVVVVMDGVAIIIVDVEVMTVVVDVKRIENENIYIVAYPPNVSG